MKHAREDWAKYRTQLSEMILDMNPESVMIVGAGRCNDIDLARLTEALDMVVLLDVDSEAMNAAVKLIPEKERAKVECVETSLTGISEEDMERLCEGLLNYARTTGRNLTYDGFRERLMAELDRLSESMIQSEEELLKSMVQSKAELMRRMNKNEEELPERFQREKVDVLVCSGVHSQLFSMLSFFIRSVISSLADIIPDAKSLEEEAGRRIHDMNNRIIPIINSVLYRNASKAVIFGNEYMPESPVEGAHQCILNVRDNYSPIERTLEWEFNREAGVKYDMLIQICKKGKLMPDSG